MDDYLTTSVEDYLKSIYKITASQQRANTNQIAEILRITPASVTGMLKKMASLDPPLVEYQKHQGVVLTPQGERDALEILRHHRLIEMFLYKVLGYEWDEVHAEADRLEHVISEKFEERIAQVLGNPQYDPHGDPIPNRDLQMPPTSNTRLYDLRTGQKAVVQRARDATPELLRYLYDLGIVPQAHLVVLDYSPFDENLKCLINGQSEPVVLGPRITRQIYIKQV